MNKDYSVDTVSDVFVQELKDYFYKCYSVLKEREIIIYGAGGYGKMMVKAFSDIGMRDNIVAICDSNPDKWGKEIEGIAICGIDAVSADSNMIIVIASQYEEEIRKVLKSYSFEIFDKPSYQVFVEEKLDMYVWENTKVNAMGFRIEWFKEYQEKFIDWENKVLPLLSDEKSKTIFLNRIEFYKTGKLESLTKIPVDDIEYFDSSYYPMSDSEIYIDCGAYTGDTVEAFIDTVKNYRKIYAFEPDIKNFKELNKRVEKLKCHENIHIFPFAIGENDGKLRFASEATLGSHISEDGNIEVSVKKLDDIITGEVSFIKMDIEGSELAALKGAKSIIKKYKPKLAICIYHKCEDLFEIPVFLHELLPEYKIVIRQHKYDLYDTVLYAWVDK